MPSLIALLLLLIYLLQPILTPFLVGMGIAYLGDPIVDRLEPTVGRIGGVVIVFAGLFLIMTLGVLLLIPMLAAELGTLIKNIPNFLESLFNSDLNFLSQFSSISLRDKDKK